jgi:hypothetical protein
MYFRQCNNEEEKREDDLLNVVVLENKVTAYCKKIKKKICTFFLIYVKENLEGDGKVSSLGNGQMFSHTYSTVY